MRRSNILILAGTVLLAGPAAFGADPVNYTVQFVKSGDKQLDKLLKQTSALVSLRKKLRPAPFALIGRAQADEKQFVTVLHSLGYDAGSVDITIDGDVLSDPNLLDTLDHLPASATATVKVVSHPGEQFTLGQVTTPGAPADFQRPDIVKPGQPALAAPILAASATLQTALHNAGYAFATVSPPFAVADVKAHKLNVTYTVKTGPHVRIGPVSFTGLKRTDPDFLRRHISLRPGQPYSETAVSNARNSLLSLGVFTAVTPLPQQHLTAGDEVPILFHVTPQKLHAVTLSGAYATDTGFTIGTSWEDRNLFGRAETLTLSVAANGLGGTGTTAPGYDVKGVFSKPDYYVRGQTLNVTLEGLRQSLTAYDRTALIAGVSLERPLTKHLGITYGPSFVTERVLQEGITRNYVLIQLPVTLTYDTTNSLFEPTHGVKASLTVTPTEPVVGSGHPFVILDGSASTYLAVEHNARGIIALRGQIGSIQGASQFQVPPDQRFYAGGSGTVRGYGYQTIGPLFADDKPEGGLSLDAASLEFRQRVGKSFGVVPFVDAGQVGPGSAPFEGKLRVGVGIGARYYTSIGPIRLDVAVPLKRTPNSGAFALYIGLGEAF
jgi:translocation and assembly module TamA